MTEIRVLIKGLVYRAIGLIRHRSALPFLIVLACFLMLRSPVIAETIGVDSSSDWQSGVFELNAIDATKSAGNITLQEDLGSWNASGPAYLTHNAYTNTRIIKVRNFLYFFRNRNLGQFLRYDLFTREWKEMAYVPVNMYEAVDMTTDGNDTIYAFATRSGRKHFMKYSITGNTWTFLDSTPLALNIGATLEYVPGTTNYVYAFQGGTAPTSGNTTFWRYNITTNGWSPVANTTATCGDMCDLYYDSSDGYLYLATNFNYSSVDGFLRYNPTSGGSWTSAGNFPLNGSVNYGSNLTKLGSNFYLMRSGGTQTFYKHNGSTWISAKDVPFVTTYGSIEADTTNNRIIVLGGIGELAYYYPENNTWSNGSTGPPANAYGTGNSLVADGGGNLYLCRGQGTQTCYKYATGTDTWSTIATAPAGGLGANGTVMAYVNNLLFVARGSSGNNIYRYNPSPTNTWTTGLNSPVATLTDGSAMTASGSGASAALFAAQGGGGTGFYRYDVTLGTWSTKAVTPESVYRGSGLVQAGMFTYLLTGYNRGKFYRYHETTNGWFELPSLPTGSYYGGGLAYDGVDSIYALAGGENDVIGRRLYRYSIGGNFWVRMADLPATVRFGAGMAWSGGKLYVYQGYGGSMWKYTPPQNLYSASGSWYSQVYDLTHVSVYGNVTITDSTPAGSGITYYSRTSDNMYEWDNWELVSNGNPLDSIARRYLQIRADLSGDRSVRPSVSSINVSYTGDTTTPNVSNIVFTAKSQKIGGTPIISSTQYSHTNPYFSWSGVVDDESGVDGYYVYFGTSPSGNPVTEGSFQRTSDYVVAKALTSGSDYYLRVAPKNGAGTAPVAVTYFTYSYVGISPATSVIVADTQAQWDDTSASASGTYAQGAGWWNRKYLYRQLLTINATNIATAGSIIRVTIDTNALESADKVRPDRKDWRIAYWNGASWKEIPRQYVGATLTNFALERSVNAGSSDANYYVYYGYSGEMTEPLQSLDERRSLAKWGGSLIFDGNDYAKITNATIINNRPQVTIEGWFRHLNGASNRWLYGDPTAGDVAIGVTTGTGVLFNNNYMIYNFRTSGTGTFTNGAGSTMIVPGQWYHVAVVYDSSAQTYNAYVNGRLDYTRTGVATINGNVNTRYQQYLGAVTTVYHYGSLDEWRISSVPRYSAEFVPSTEPFIADADTLALYHFDETGTQTIVDSSVNANNATLGSGVTLDGSDPNWTRNTVAVAGAEVGVGSVSDSDTSLTLAPLPEGSWAGYQISSLPFGVRQYAGASLHANGFLYVLRGRDTRTFYRMNTATGSWTQLADMPRGPSAYGAYYGAAMAWDGADTIYALKGRASNEFYAYTISTNTWSNQIDQPVFTFSSGATIAKAGNMPYILAGGGSSSVYSFNMANASTTDGIDAWSTLQAAPYTVTYGAGLVYDGNNTLWMVAGSGFGFAKYSINVDTWDTTVSAPAQPPYAIGYSTDNAIIRNNKVYTFTSYDYQANNGTKHFLWEYDIAGDKWRQIDSNATEFWAQYGSIAYDGNRYAYLIQGVDTNPYGTTALVRYDFETNTYSPETPPLPIDRNYQNDGEQVQHQLYTGTSLVYDGAESVYVLQGSTSYVNRYNTSTKRWTLLPNIPCTYAGGAVFAQGKLYAICGNGTKRVYSYDPIASEWATLANTPGPLSETVTSGGNQIAVYDNSDSIYVLRGGGSTTLYKYSIGGNEWTTESTLIPGSIGNSWGASITYDGGDYLYILRGNGTANFYRYKVTATKGWTTLTDLPEALLQGSGSVLHDGKIYVTAGYNNTGVYIYDIASASWQIAPQAPSHIGPGGALVQGPGHSLYALQGNYTFTLWKYNIPSSGSSYVHSGEYMSRVIDLGTPYTFAGLTAQISSPSATSFSFDTRSSSDSASWTNWYAAATDQIGADGTYSFAVTSPTNRYIQTRVRMESEESASSAAVANLTLRYYEDAVAPTNPSALTASTSSAALAASLTQNEWKNFSRPYFSWTGASDVNGSGVAGYYVYFGNDSTAIASMEGELQETASFSASLATDGSEDGDVYLRIQTVDRAGNINPSIWDAFHYKYDSTAPNEVGNDNMSVLPSGYTATNNYRFSWLPVTDRTMNGTSSGFLRYEMTYTYVTPKAGVTGCDSLSASGSALVDLHTVTEEGTTDTEIQIPCAAYQEATNTFRVRARDVAGNVTSYSQASYYFNSTAPSAPRNIAVDLSQAGSNRFSFTWDAPSSYKDAIKEYRYSINVPPAEGNVSTTSARIVNNIRGTQTGDNVFYVVAVDSANNVNYGNYATKTFSVNITAPGIPLNPEAFDNSIRSTGQYRVGLTWDAPTEKGSAFDRYEVYASDESTECSTDLTGYMLAGSTAGTSYVVTSIGETELESVEYNFCVVACATTNQCSSPSTTLSIMPTGRWLTAPEMVGTTSATVKTKTALIQWSTSRAANTFVKYGTEKGVYGNEVGSSEQVTAHTINLTELKPGTTYYYQMLWTDEDGNLGSSDEYSFVTNAAPSIANVKFSRVNINSAQVGFTVSNAIKATVQYGKTLSYGSVETISTSKSESTYAVNLETLTEGTLYHIRIAAEDDESNIYYSDDYTFQTLPTPKITNLRLQQVVGMPTATVRLLWSTNTLTSSIVTYYPTQASTKAQDSISLALKRSHEVILQNLMDDTEYTFLIKGRDSSGNEAKTETRTVKTATDIRPPEIQNLNVESTIIGVGENAKAQIVVTWDTDEPGTTQVEYGQGTGTTYNQTTQEDTNKTSNHVVTITGLSPAKIYHLRAISKDKADNIGTSLDTVIITPKSTKDALNLVIDNLSKTFGFLKGLSILK